MNTSIFTFLLNALASEETNATFLERTVQGIWQFSSSISSVFQQSSYTHGSFLLQLLNYRVIEWFGLGLSLDWVTQKLIQPVLKQFQRCGIHNFSGPPVPAPSQ